jgi:peptide/nickel transport system permease protein
MQQLWRQLRRNRLALSGGIIVAGMMAVALLAPVLAPYDPSAIDVGKILTPPSHEHVLGTDALGRDVLSRILYGTRVSLLVGFVAVGIAVAIGVAAGSISGYYLHAIDTIIMRLVDIMLSIPTFFLILAVVALVEPSLINIMVVIGLTSWMGVTRLVRGQFLVLKESDYVIAARALGVPAYRIIFRHILPNAMAPVYVATILGIGAAVLVESALSYLGLGVQPPTPSWGNILTEGKANIEIAWWMTLFPGLAILVTVLGYNLLGEGLRDALDPRLKNITK